MRWVFLNPSIGHLKSPTTKYPVYSDPSGRVNAFHPGFGKRPGAPAMRLSYFGSSDEKWEVKISRLIHHGSKLENHCADERSGRRYKTASGFFLALF